ncbi:hypothetical protein GCM10022199_18060 [Marihabitans asiaticum]|uniref:Uncharacterized protein (TIGR02611 family) n=1 Tax=Marihabitans asiaticum TaxID=415218 RepID=A0A560W6R9_9MICO|nr:TIGR02611 family protein [Marihabitans asiaticum]TWD13316.1 uncharacterized protein (TIGR02611 family) [Marihabitans asiaticum]
MSTTAEAAEGREHEEGAGSRGHGLDAQGHRRPYRAIRGEQHAMVREELIERFGEDQRIDPEEDPIAWRRAIRCNPALAPFYRGGVFVVGLALIIVGIPMVPLVGPGWVVIFIGLFLWSTEFRWARKVTQFVKAEVKAFDQWARHLPWKLKIPMVLLTLAFCWLCGYLVLLLTGVPGWTPDAVEEYLRMLPGLAA